MKFGERLLSSQHPPWSGNYIDYLRLKRLLETLFDLEASIEDGGGGGLVDSHKRSESDFSSPLHHHYDAPTNSGIIPTLQAVTRVESSHSFEKELKHEIQKALLFLLKSMGELASDLSSLSEQRRSVSVGVRDLLREGEDENDAANVDDLQKQQSEQLGARRTLHEIGSLRMEYLVRIGSKLLLLLEFVELNIEAIVKIVKKHDKLLSNWEESHHPPTGGQKDKSRYTRLRRHYLPRFAAYSSDPNVRCLFVAAADAGDCGRERRGSAASLNMSVEKKSQHGSFGGWDVIQWNLEVALRELFQWEGDLQGLMNGNTANKMEDQADDSKLDTFIPLSSRSFSDILLGPDSGSGSITSFLHHSSSILGLANTDASSSRLTLPTKMVNGKTFFEPIIYQIQSSRRRLGQMHSRYIRMVYAHEMLHLIDDKNLQQEDEKYMMQRSEDFGSVEQLEKMRRDSIGSATEGEMWIESHPVVSNLSKCLNLASAGMYMCNYNIVAPTSGLYAKLLGFDPANAGIIIGMTPAAVIISSVLYSWWSSYSYKRALMFASFCCMVGNIVYALALPCKSLKMVLLGRLLTGFGSARVINRRYIADYYSLENRTSGMADFVSASALGMALGPAIAASLSIVAPVGHSDINSFWTIETAPGYVMFVLWAIYLTCNMMYFEEPDRAVHSATTTKASSRSESGGETTDITTAHSENSPLLNASTNEKGPSNVPNDVKAMKPLLRSWGNTPVLISLVLLVLLKCVLEGVSSSAPTVSRHYFGWGSHNSGIYLAALASVVLPTNFVVAYVSRRFDDRELILVTLCVMFVGILGFLVYGDNYSETRYILFGIIVFVACNALEGPTMGLLSKTIPKSLARGILNAGLLATEAGTLGRVIGDFWLSGATFMGLDQLVNRTFEPMCVMVGLSICATWWSYSELQPRFDLDDDDDDD